MKLKSPQPNQTFWHVAPSGNSYHSDEEGHLTPLTPADECSLRALGCVDVPDKKEPVLAADGAPSERTFKTHPPKEDA